MRLCRCSGALQRYAPGRLAAPLHFSAEAKNVTAEFVRWGTRLACSQALRPTRMCEKLSCRSFNSVLRCHLTMDPIRSNRLPPCSRHWQKSIAFRSCRPVTARLPGQQPDAAGWSSSYDSKLGNKLQPRNNLPEEAYGYDQCTQ